jgi:hypothetical protein
MPVTPGPADLGDMRDAVAMVRAILDSDDQARYAIMRDADPAVLAFHCATLASVILRRSVKGDISAARAILDDTARRMLAAEADPDGQP